MVVFEVRQCTDPACQLRVPMDPQFHSGQFCPRCGGGMKIVVSEYQNATCSQPVSEKSRRIVAVLDNVRSAYNVGAIFRTADGVGVSQIFLCGITPNPGENPSIAKSALGAEVDIPWKSDPNAENLLRDLRERGFYLLALECTPGSMSLQNVQADISDGRPIALLVGNERAGVDPGLLELCDGALALPMVGKKASLNVGVAFGVAAYWLMFR